MNDLDAFLQAAKARGANDAFLVAMLQEHGWPASTVYQALGRHYAEATGIAIPAARGRLESAREAFFHLLAFATLATWIFATGVLWFLLIDQSFPDPAVPYRQSFGLSQVSWQMASLMVAFPVFVFATRAILQDRERNPEQAASAVGRWLTNIALLITALIFIGDLMAFVNALLQGELTIRFVLQCLTVFLLAGAVFLYYNRKSTRLWNRSFAVAAALLILTSLSLGFWRTGSPSEGRMRAQDARRVRDLHAISQQIHNHWQRQPAQERKLPLSLDQIGTTTDRGLVLIDPFTNAPYEYLPGNRADYELCAAFDRETESRPHAPKPAWSHNQGRHCFALNASTYPPYPGQED